MVLWKTSQEIGEEKLRGGYNRSPNFYSYSYIYLVYIVYWRIGELAKEKSKF